MNYQSFNMGSYNIHFIKTTKFKTITIEVNFRRKVNHNEITKRNLLKTILLNSTNSFPNEIDLVKESENLYDLKLLSYTSRIGNYSNLSFKVRFLDEKYTERQMNKKSLLFLMDVIFNPNVKNGKFDEKILELCKENHKKTIESLKDSKVKYTLLKLLETTKNKPYSYCSYGSIEDLDTINACNLYEYYKDVLDKDLIDVFIVGDVDINMIKELFRDNFKVETFKKKNSDIIVEELLPAKRIKKLKINDEVEQTQLTLLCTLNNLTEFERKYVIRLYNEILGGSSNSLLFTNVREKKSFAYYINSTQKAYDNVLLIYSGISKENIEKVLKLIRKTLLDIEKGNFSDELINNCKETIISSIKASVDSPNGIINTYYARCLVNSDDYENRIENISKITKNDLINISKKIKVHTMLVLEGGENNGKD